MDQRLDHVTQVRLQPDGGLLLARVLGVDLNADPTSSKPASPNTATIEVSVEESQKLAIAATLGGYVAEEMLFDDVTTGPSNDLMVITHLARDMVARYGGEEFVALFPETSLEQARTLCETLRRSVEQSTSGRAGGAAAADGTAGSVSATAAAAAGATAGRQSVRLRAKPKIDFVRLNLAVDADIGEVVTDPQRVRQIVMNLVSNAAKYGEQKPIDILCRREETGYIAIEVVDQGIEVPCHHPGVGQAGEIAVQRCRTRIGGRHVLPALTQQQPDENLAGPVMQVASKGKDRVLRQEFVQAKFGIHVHNDGGLAVANTLAAVEPQRTLEVRAAGVRARMASCDGARSGTCEPPSGTFVPDSSAHAVRPAKSTVSSKVTGIHDGQLASGRPPTFIG